MRGVLSLALRNRVGEELPLIRSELVANVTGTCNFLEADFWKVSGIPLVRLKLHREVTATVKLAVQKQE